MRIGVSKIKAWVVPRVFLSPLVVIVIISTCSIVVNVCLYAGVWQEAHTIFTLGILSFTIGFLYVSFVSSFLYKNREQRYPRLKSRRYVLRFYWALTILSAGIGVYILITRGVMGSEDLFVNLRRAHTVEKKSSMGMEHLSLFSLALALYYAINDSKNKSNLAALFFLFTSLVIAQRTTILLLFSALLYVYAWKRKLSVISLILNGFLFIILTCVLAFLTGKGGGVEDFFLPKYFAYGLTSFQDNILSQPTYNCPKMIFGNIFGSLVELLGVFSCEAPDQFVESGIFNVYTYVKEPYLFGGQIAVVLSMSILGLIYSALYSVAKRYEKYALAVLSCMIYPVIMVFFAWQFSLTTNIYMILIFIPLFYDIGLFKYNRIQR